MEAKMIYDDLQNDRYEEDLKAFVSDLEFDWWYSVSLAYISLKEGKFDHSKLKSFNVSYRPYRVEYAGELGMYPAGSKYMYDLLVEEMQAAMYPGLPIHRWSPPEQDEQEDE